MPSGKPQNNVLPVTGHPSVQSSRNIKVTISALIIVPCSDHRAWWWGYGDQWKGEPWNLQPWSWLWTLTPPGHRPGLFPQIEEGGWGATKLEKQEKTNVSYNLVHQSFLHLCIRWQEGDLAMCYLGQRFICILKFCDISKSLLQKVYTSLQPYQWCMEVLISLLPPNTG